MVSARFGVDLRRAAHLAHHDDQRALEQAARFEVFDQRGIRPIEDRQVRVFEHAEIILVHVIRMAVAAEDFGMHADERHARFNEPARDEQTGTAHVAAVAFAQRI